MPQIMLSGTSGAGKYAQVDEQDYPRLVKHSWYYKDGYALAKINNKETRMHRLVLNVTDPLEIVDHVNRNRLDNRRKNLRIYNPQQNANNRETKTRNKMPTTEKPTCLLAVLAKQRQLPSGQEIAGVQLVTTCFEKDFLTELNFGRRYWLQIRYNHARMSWFLFLKAKYCLLKNNCPCTDIRTCELLRRKLDVTNEK
jgi:hypothetical protein